MPLEYKVDAAARRVFTTAYGRVSFDEIAQHIEATAKDPEVDPAYSELTDLRQVEAIDLTSDQVAEIANERVFSATSRRAIVAPQPLFFGIARMYGTHHSSGGKAIVKVFSTMHEALGWLDDGTIPPF